MGELCHCFGGPTKSQLRHRTLKHPFAASRDPDSGICQLLSIRSSATTPLAGGVVVRSDACWAVLDHAHHTLCSDRRMFAVYGHHVATDHHGASPSHWFCLSLLLSCAFRT